MDPLVCLKYIFMLLKIRIVILITAGADTGYQAKLSGWASIASVGMVHPQQQPWGKCPFPINYIVNCIYIYCILTRTAKLYPISIPNQLPVTPLPSSSLEVILRATEIDA